MTEFKIGQKWISTAEPELAMGRIIRIDHRTVSVFFDISSEERTYAKAQAPLTRVKFNTHDKIATQDGITITITSVNEKDGIFIYHGDYLGTNTAVIETELDPNVRFSKPEDRLFTHQFDLNASFNLRYDTLRHTARLASAQSRGLYGPRISLIPHQLYIASEVASRFAPRVLLADEVGLGKTIEAGLIVHQQLQTGRASRVLIIVPAALTFQWFVEMIRRFNLQFTVLNEERIQQIVADNTDAVHDEEPESEESQSENFNPFDAQQLMLCSLDLFTENSRRLEQVLDAEWDLVVVDEAHHLAWSETQVSIEYQVVERISQVTQGLLLLTATPEQLGRSGHFARLKLLDPNRFHDYGHFIQEEAQFEAIADAASMLLEGSEDEKSQARATVSTLVNLNASDDDLISALLDRHGTGRVLFRNVRTAIQGFPQRLIYPAALEMPEQYNQSNSFFPQTEFPNWTSFDLRIPWLIELLQSRPEDKFLLICAHQATAMALEQKLSELVAIRITLFHEGMDLVARDRAANYFSETERGAQLMICSEIGSEGRNFQFASDLVLFDLPLGPDLLEQRIGRLDRIGQKNDVSIHIPYFKRGPSESLFRFFAEGVNSLSAPNPVAQGIFDEVESLLLEDDLDLLLTRVGKINTDRLAQLNKGRDRLLELNSHRPEVSADIVADIETTQGGRELEIYMEQSFDMYGLESEDVGNGIITIKPTEGMARHDSISIETLDHFHYPELPEDGIRITYNRHTAAAMEDVRFFTWENPIVQQALDVATADVTGNSTMIAVKHEALKAGTVLVEVIHIVDCVAPAKLMADKYLPPSIIRSVIDPDLKNQHAEFPFQGFIEEILDVPQATLGKILDGQMAAIKAMIEKSAVYAREELDQLKTRALILLNSRLNQEITRLEELQKVNQSVRPEEIDHLRDTLASLTDAINHADVRMDSLRVIVAA